MVVIVRGVFHALIVLCGLRHRNFRDYRVPDYLLPGSTRHKGTVGCYLAHRRALGNLALECASRQYAGGQVLILEDDIALSDAFWPHVRSLEFPSDGDMVFFDNSHKNGITPDPEHLIDRDKELYRTYTGWPAFFGAFAYVVPVENLPRLCHLLDHPPEGVYWDVDGFYIRNTRAYTYRTNMVRLTCGVSDRNPDHLV